MSGSSPEPTAAPVPSAGSGVVRHLIAGPQEHGVVRHGLGLWTAVQEVSGPVLQHRLQRAPSADRLPDPEPLAAGQREIVHVSFTDHLFGADPAAAAARAAELADGALLSAGLHDVPQPQEGAQRFRRRGEGYRALLRAADLVIANSEHEAAQLRELAPEAAPRIRVVPLPLEAPAGSAASADSPAAPAPAHRARSAVPAEGGPVVGLLGFLYPGKGYEAVLDAVPAGTRVRALGAIACGHDDWAAQLTEQAQRRGISFEITGYLPDEALAWELDAVDVPVCPHRHVSASGSLNTWIAHGRVPLALDGPYMREIAQRWPGHLLLTSREQLPERLGELLEHPERTRAAAAPPVWGWPEVAAACERAWAEALA